MKGGFTTTEQNGQRAGHKSESIPAPGASAERGRGIDAIPAASIGCAHVNGHTRPESFLRNALYYRVKPWLPIAFRLAMRRWLAQWKRPRVQNIWPILPGSEIPPAGWTGWPENKRFAFVLTHDVEGSRGIERSVPLMQLEKQAGFRSSFNFVPEGTSPVPREVREQLESNGFEVGVHDLKHDGFLYRSRKSFQSNAERINGYLKEWNASGFRSGFMLHNLRWAEDLNVLYDASTFDTDPFEPQPDGVGTIFPFWVPGENGRGFVELPYTLIQDFNLFIVLQEQTIDIWKQKLDWIAAHGGMALLIVHPDYVNLSGGAPSAHEFPAARYREFLEYVKSKYAGQYWQALPREVAGYVAKMKPLMSARTAASALDPHSAQ